jgi:8-oxo-dGTP pyrophosphatase MutT (NUDIX family)
MAKKNRIRPVALCIFRHGDRILVGEGYDEIKGQTFYRPIGGGIKFGEYGHQTVTREVMEEIKQGVADVRYLGTLENVFVFNGQPGHEIIRIYDGTFTNSDVYNRDTVVRTDVHESSRIARWLPLDLFRRGEAPLYPDGLLELLAGS